MCTHSSLSYLRAVLDQETAEDLALWQLCLETHIGTAYGAGRKGTWLHCTALIYSRVCVPTLPISRQHHPHGLVKLRLILLPNPQTQTTTPAALSRWRQFMRYGMSPTRWRSSTLTA